MNLSTLLGFQNQNTNHAQKTAGTGAVSGAASGALTSAADIRGLLPGQTIQGEVVSTKGNEVVISMENGILLNARLDKNMQIAAGQQLIFEVKSNSGSRLALSPLFENTGQDPNILKALTAAGMSPSANNINMVSILMKEGMPIDRNTLQAFQRQMMLNESANPVTLAQMNRLQIPQTPENIAQFEAYKNYQHQISQSVLEIADGLTNTLSGMIQGGDGKSAAALFKDVIFLLTQESTAKPEQTPAGNISPIQTENLTSDGKLPGSGSGTALDAGEALMAKAGTGNMTSSQASGETAGQNAVLPEGQSEASQVVANIKGAVSLEMLPDAAGTGKTPIIASADDISLLAQGANKELLPLSPENREQLSTLLKEAGFPEALTAKVSSGAITEAALLKEMAKSLPDLTADKLIHLAGSKEMGNIFKSEFSRQWLLLPEEVAGDRQLESLYKRLQDQTSRLTEALSQVAKADTPLANTVNNLSQNINFVNQLNQMFTYVQLPLKMNGENTHGELYIYTNKKNLAKKDGNVSALLHLDMDHLGPVDVYVTMQNQKVSTKFYLPDDNTIDLISNHIHILNERLEKKGYAMQSELAVKDQDGKGVVEEMLEANKNVPLLASYSFDARA